MFFFPKNPERGKNKKKKKKTDRQNKSVERTVPEPEFEKQSHFYDTRMTFRKQEIKTTLTCI